MSDAVTPLKEPSCIFEQKVYHDIHDRVGRMILTVPKDDYDALRTQLEAVTKQRDEIMREHSSCSVAQKLERFSQVERQLASAQARIRELETAEIEIENQTVLSTCPTCHGPCQGH